MAKRKRRAFTTEFKARAVRIVRESGKSVGVVARGTGSHGDGAAELGAAGGDRRRPWGAGGAYDRGAGGARPAAARGADVADGARMRLKASQLRTSALILLGAVTFAHEPRVIRQRDAWPS